MGRNQVSYWETLMAPNPIGRTVLRRGDYISLVILSQASPHVNEKH